MCHRLRHWSCGLLTVVISICSPMVALGGGDSDGYSPKPLPPCTDSEYYSIKSLLGSTLPDGARIPEDTSPSALFGDTNSIHWLNDANQVGNNFSIVSAIVNRDDVDHDVNWPVGQIRADNLGYCEYVARSTHDAFFHPNMTHGNLEYGRDSTIIETEVYRGYMPKLETVERAESSAPSRVFAGTEDSNISVTMSWSVKQVEQGTDRYSVELRLKSVGTDQVELTILPTIDAPEMARAIAMQCQNQTTLQEPLVVNFEMDGVPHPVFLGLILTRPSDGLAVRTYLVGYGG